MVLIANGYSVSLWGNKNIQNSYGMVIIVNSKNRVKLKITYQAKHGDVRL
jgi:hypothetical protein